MSIIFARTSASKRAQWMSQYEQFFGMVLDQISHVTVTNLYIFGLWYRPYQTRTNQMFGHPSELLRVWNTITLHLWRYFRSGFIHLIYVATITGNFIETRQQRCRRFHCPFCTGVNWSRYIMGDLDNRPEIWKERIGRPSIRLPLFDDCASIFSFSTLTRWFITISWMLTDDPLTHFHRVGRQNHS
jgi:hypothetical protein